MFKLFFSIKDGLNYMYMVKASVYKYYQKNSVLSKITKGINRCN